MLSEMLRSLMKVDWDLSIKELITQLSRVARILLIILTRVFMRLIEQKSPISDAQPFLGMRMIFAQLIYSRFYFPSEKSKQSWAQSTWMVSQCFEKSRVGSHWDMALYSLWGQKLLFWSPLKKMGFLKNEGLSGRMKVIRESHPNVVVTLNPNSTKRMWAMWLWLRHPFATTWKYLVLASPSHSQLVRALCR